MMRISFSYLHEFILILIITVITSSSLLGQTKPVIGLHENVPKVILLTNARIMVSPGNILESGQMLIRNDQIESVGKTIKQPADAVVRNLNGKTIYPGFIDLFTSYGLKSEANQSQDKSSEAATNWHKAIHPEMSAGGLLKTDTKTAESLRECGFTNVVTFPEEGIFRGSGALIQLADKKPNEIILRNDVAQAMSFSKGKSFKGKGINAYPSSLMGSIAIIRQTFLDAQWYEQAWVNYNRAPNGQLAPDTDISLSDLQ
jgi:hypothetical protein